MNMETLYDVVLLDNEKIAVQKHADGQEHGHVTGVFLTRKEALTNARKLARQHGLELVS